MPYGIAVSLALRGIAGTGFAWRNTFNAKSYPRFAHPGIDAISRWQANSSGTIAVQAPPSVALGAALQGGGAGPAEQTNGQRLAARSITVIPPGAGAALGVNGSGSEKVFAWESYMGCMFRPSTMTDVCIAVGVGVAFLPGTPGFGSAGVDTFPHACLISHPSLNAGRWTISTRTSGAGDLTQQDLLIPVSTTADTLVELTFSSSTSRLEVIINGDTYYQSGSIPAASTAFDQFAWPRGMVVVGGGAVARALDNYSGWYSRL